MCRKLGLTSVDDIVIVEVVDCFEDLANGL
jgi:hypothetical protein